MNRTMKLTTVWLIVLEIVLAGCAAPIGTQPPTTPLALTATALTSPAPTATPTSEPTAAPTQAPATQTPTVEPSATAVVIPTLDVREPSPEQLVDYLRSLFPDDINVAIYSEGTKTAPTYENVSGVAKPVLTVRDSAIGTIALQLVYEDVSGDNVDDLIAHIPAEVFIFVWSRDHYAEPYRKAKEEMSWAGPSSIISFYDWTQDGTPEINLDDDDTSVHGTGILGIDTTRYIIYCQDSDCHVVWEHGISSRIADLNFGGMLRYQSTLKPATDKNGRPAINSLFNGFSVYCCSVIGNSDYKSLRVITSTLSTYSWTGSAFELSEEEIASLPRQVNSQSIFEATSGAGTKATISVRSVQGFEEMHDECQLIIADESIGSPLRCRGNFVSVEWKDITGDGQEDAIVIAFTGYGQTLVAYQWDGSQAIGIAHVSGYTVEADLYGVRFEDFDKDGQLEILAAADEYHTHDQIYKWNGTKFVFWDDVPGQ